MDGVVENGTHALHGNPTMALRLIAKGIFSHVLWIQEHDRDRFERSRGGPTHLNVFKCVLGTWIRQTNGTNIEVQGNQGPIMSGGGVDKLNTKSSGEFIVVRFTEMSKSFKLY
ncbi:hypothetical protein TNCV_528501 [Trichonephila clavipes]|nr:hypothetical protein TNCV_528501 [Trichonephila clavipes]